MNHFVTLCYCALDKQRCPRNLSTQPEPIKRVEYKCDAVTVDHSRCERMKRGSYLCGTDLKHIGDQNLCRGFNNQRKGCKNAVTGTAYCWQHMDKECGDIEMGGISHSQNLRGEDSEDVIMGGTWSVGWIFFGFCGVAGLGGGYLGTATLSSLQHSDNCSTEHLFVSYCATLIDERPFDVLYLNSTHVRWEHRETLGSFWRHDSIAGGWLAEVCSIVQQITMTAAEKMVSYQRWLCFHIRIVLYTEVCTKSSEQH